MTCLVGAWLLPGVGGAFAKAHAAIDLKSVQSQQRVEAISYCAGRFRVRLQDGSRREFGEIDLRLKIDSGPLGPRPGVPVLVPAGSVGDRANLVFSSPEELKAMLVHSCEQTEHR
jgi:cytochrome c